MKLHELIIHILSRFKALLAHERSQRNLAASERLRIDELGDRLQDLFNGMQSIAEELADAEANGLPEYLRDRLRARAKHLDCEFRAVRASLRTAEECQEVHTREQAVGEQCRILADHGLACDQENARELYKMKRDVSERRKNAIIDGRILCEEFEEPAMEQETVGVAAFSTRDAGFDLGPCLSEDCSEQGSSKTCEQQRTT